MALAARCNDSRHVARSVARREDDRLFRMGRMDAPKVHGNHSPYGSGPPPSIEPDFRLLAC